MTENLYNIKYKQIKAIFTGIKKDFNSLKYAQKLRIEIKYAFEILLLF